MFEMKCVRIPINITYVDFHWRADISVFFFFFFLAPFKTYYVVFMKCQNDLHKMLMMMCVLTIAIVEFKLAFSSKIL